jgi:hypothetical protein
LDLSPEALKEGIRPGMALAAAERKSGNVLKLLDQTHSPKEPDIYCQGNNDLVHLGCL